MLVETYLICQKIKEQYELIEKYEEDERNSFDNDSNDDSSSFGTSNETTLTPSQAKAAAGVTIVILVLVILAVISLYVWAIILLVHYGQYCDPVARTIAIVLLFVPGIGPIPTIIIMYATGCVSKGTKKLKKKSKKK